MDQLSIFGYLYEDYKIRNKIRLIELFAGVGSQAMALRDLGVDFESYRVVEFDKYAIKSYNAIHGTNFPTLDIRDIHCEDLGIVDKQNVTYLLTYSFPCQDLSKAGKQRGMTKGSGTRSGLLWEVERILNECKEKDSLPQVLLMENVPDVIGTKNYEDFMKWYVALENMGYQSYYKVLNAKDYGIPQNRERCFMVSILGDYNYTFPKPMPLKLRLKDMLEESADEKYYISNKLLACFTDTKDRNGFVRAERFNPHDIEDEYAFSITTSAGNRATDNFIKVKEATKKGYDIAIEGDSINLEQPNSQTRRGRVGKQVAQTLTTSCNQGVIDFYNHRVKDDDFIGTLTTNCGNVGHCGCFGVKEKTGIDITWNDVGDTTEISRALTTSCRTLSKNQMSTGVLENGIRIRKLTPLECWRLMGFTDEDFEKAEKVNSNTQLYKQAGNSIVKQVLMAIFKQMID